ncbi:MAG: DUF3095 domain-containing protein [Granulosicoccus sp.]|nr:DUF3095 domain-containing protein [Granulosicoccus sp.]
MSTEFFRDLPESQHFLGIVEKQSFYPAPDDWIIVVADVRGSTKAVKDGQYKQVNMIGGAVITAILNATGSRDLPFVFGGDGATVLIPETHREVVEVALVRTRTLAREEYSLELRIGFVPVHDVRTRGVDVLVARYTVAGKNSLAAFGGGGVELADALVKSEQRKNPYRIKDYEVPGRPDLEGLSCRWEPLQSKKGHICCILIQATGEDFTLQQKVLKQVIDKIIWILGSNLEQANPVAHKSLNLSWPPAGLAAEARLTRSGRSTTYRYLQILLQSLIQYLLNRFNRRAGAYDAPVYRNEMIYQNDFCKYDDVLRMVLDCKTDQIARIRAILREELDQGRINFGLFTTDEALMTCLVFDLDTSQHMHFIDGNHGGFSAASVEFKQQLASNAKSLQSA